MTTVDLQARIDAIPENADWNDPATYAALGVGVDEPGDETGEQEEQGETGQAAAAPAPAPAAAPVAAPAPTESSQAPAAAPAPSEPERIDGVATADGKRVIPYAVLKQAREVAHQATVRAEAAEAALEEAKRQAPKPGASDLADRAQANPDSLTDEEMAELEQDFPALAKPLRLLRAASDQLRTAAAPAPAPAAPAPAPRTAPKTREEDEAEFDEGIAANPLLAQWMGSGGREWERAKALDAVLKDDPSCAGLSYADRFAKVQRMVAAEFDIPLPSAAAPKPAPSPAAPAAAPAAPAAPAAKTAPLPSLSDLGGTPPQSAEDAINSKTALDLLASTEHMTEAQLMAMAGISY